MTSQAGISDVGFSSDGACLVEAGGGRIKSIRMSDRTVVTSLDLASVGEEHEQPAASITASATGRPLYHTTELPEVRIAAKVLFSGLAPGLTAVWQVSVVAPEEAPVGKVPVAISYEGNELRSVDIEVK